MKSLKLGLFKTDSGAIFPGRGKNQETSLASPGDTRWGYVDLAMPVQVVCNCEDKFDHLVKHFIRYLSITNDILFV
jgi:hypothetical protein